MLCEPAYCTLFHISIQGTNLKWENKRELRRKPQRIAIFSRQREEKLSRDLESELNKTAEEVWEVKWRMHFPWKGWLITILRCCWQWKVFTGSAAWRSLMTDGRTFCWNRGSKQWWRLCVENSQLLGGRDNRGTRASINEQEYGITGQIFEGEHFDYWREVFMKRKFLKMCVRERGEHEKWTDPSEKRGEIKCR